MSHSSCEELADNFAGVFFTLVTSFAYGEGDIAVLDHMMKQYCGDCTATVLQRYLSLCQYPPCH